MFESPISYYQLSFQDQQTIRKYTEGIIKIYTRICFQYPNFPLADEYNKELCKWVEFEFNLRSLCFFRCYNIYQKLEELRKKHEQAVKLEANIKQTNKLITKLNSEYEEIDRASNLFILSGDFPSEEYESLVEQLKFGSGPPNDWSDVENEINPKNYEDDFETIQEWKKWLNSPFTPLSVITFNSFGCLDLNFEEKIEFILSTLFNKGTIEEILHAINYYGITKALSTIKKSIELNQLGIECAINFFHIKKEELRSAQILN